MVNKYVGHSDELYQGRNRRGFRNYTIFLKGQLVYGIVWMMMKLHAEQLTISNQKQTRGEGVRDITNHHFYNV